MAKHTTFNKPIKNYKFTKRQLVVIVNELESIKERHPTTVIFIGATKVTQSKVRSSWQYDVFCYFCPGARAFKSDFWQSWACFRGRPAEALKWLEGAEVVK